MGDASKQLETLYKPEKVDKLNNAKADVLKLCRQWWEEFKRTTRKDVIEKSDGFKAVSYTHLTLPTICSV